MNEPNTNYPLLHLIAALVLPLNGAAKTRDTGLKTLIYFPFKWLPYQDRDSIGNAGRFADDGDWGLPVYSKKHGNLQKRCLCDFCISWHLPSFQKKGCA